MSAHQQKIFLNLAVDSIERARAFYEQLGWVNDPAHSDTTLAMMALPPLDAFKCGVINIMLLSHGVFRGSTPANREAILDARKATEVMMCLSATSQAEVDLYLSKAKDAGAELDVGFKVDAPGLYARSFSDLDGHVWEVMYNASQNPNPESQP